MRAAKKKITPAVVAGATVLALGGGAAYAYFTSGGNAAGAGATGVSSLFEIDVAQFEGPNLLPGVGAQTVAFTVTNPSTAGHQKLNLVTVAVQNADGTAWTSVDGCSAADYTVSVTTAPTYDDMAPGATRTGVATLTMNNLDRVQDGCEGATVPLRFVAS